LLALLVAVLAVFAAWMTVLKPSSSNSPSVSNPPAPQVSKPATTHAKTSATASTGKTTTAPAKTQAAVHNKAKATAAAKAAAEASAAKHRLASVDAALRHGQVLALLFYNPKGADDQADRQEIAAIPTHHGKVFRLAIPVQDLSSYSVITDQVPVTGTPTLVVIDSHHRATMLAGFADGLEIDQLVSAALATK
jgi:hypothetical protein